MNAIKIQEPTTCPFCGSPVERILDEGAHIYCTNPNCPERRLAKLNYFVTKECMNIDGLSEKTLRKLIDNLGITCWWDLYSLHFDDFVAGGCGDKTALKIHDEIQNSRTSVSADKVLMALGIPMIGKVTAKKLLETYGSIKGIDCCANSDNRADIQNLIGEVAGQKVIDYFTSTANVDEIYNVYKWLNYTYDAPTPISTNTKLTGLTILATGTLQNFTRDGIKDSVIANGGTYASGVSKKLSFLLVGDAPGASKIAKANELGIKQISETDYLNMIQ